MAEPRFRRLPSDSLGWPVPPETPPSLTPSSAVFLPEQPPRVLPVPSLPVRAWSLHAWTPGWGAGQAGAA